MANLVRFSPSTELRRMQREFDRLFEDFFPLRLGNGELDASTWTPRADLTETEDAYVIQLDAPGLQKEDLTVNYEDDVLTVSGERKWSKDSKDQNVVRRERSYGSFYRTFRLPKAVNSDKISASYDAGVLTVRVPKAEESKPRRIKIA